MLYNFNKNLNMLTTLRNSSKNTILKFVLGTLLTVLIISFAMWGTEDLVGVSKDKVPLHQLESLIFQLKSFIHFIQDKLKKLGNY